MVQLKHLEKSLESAIIEGSLIAYEPIIDEYLDTHEYISAVASTKLHETLYKMWTGGLLNQKDDGSSSTTLTPVSTKAADSPTPAFREASPATNSRVVFLQALVRLGPCIVETDKLLQWWDELSVFAIDSTGHPFDIVNLSQEFFMGVITGSFYEHTDSAISELAGESAKAYGTKLLELYLSQSLPRKSVGVPTAERVRYVRQNCRIYFGHYGRKRTKGAFSMLNEFFVQPQYRQDVLNLVVEYLSQSQNSKLFKIYDTAFFESLLLCLEHDKTKPVLQLALTALSMCIVHVCDKLVPTRLLFRIYACFGRACSWQCELSDPSGEGKSEDDTESSAIESDDDTLSVDRAGRTGRRARKSHSAQPQSDWLELTHDWGVDAGELSEQTVDVLPLFTFLYGLFPQNTLLFCRQCDEYLAKHQYQRTFSDFWSRFMVTKKVEAIVREFRVDPLLLTTTPETELSGSVQRFQAIGSALGVTSVITSRLISQPLDVDIDEAIEEHQQHFQALISAEPETQSEGQSKLEIQAKTESTAATKTDAKAEAKAEATRKDSAASHSAPQAASHSAKQSTPRSDANSEAHTEAVTESHADVQLTPSSASGAGRPLSGWAKFDEAPRSAEYWRRELLLLRNELAFTDFRRHMSEQRSLRWQKRASRWAIAELRNDELTRQNQLMELKVGSLKEESQRALRSARTIMRERSAYETKILDRNREFREQITNLENEVLMLRLDAEAARHAEAALTDVSRESEEKAGEVELQLRALRNEADAAERVKVDKEEARMALEQTEEPVTADAEDAELARIKLEIESLKSERDAAIALMEREVAAAQAEVARVHSTQERQTQRRSSIDATADAVAHENLTAMSRLKHANEELLHRCVTVEHELRARKIHEEERMNELQAALISARAFAPLEPPAESRFRGRGGAQGVPRRA